MQATATPVSSVKENHISPAVIPGAVNAQGMMARNTAARIQSEAIERTDAELDEEGQDGEESGLGEEQVLVAETSAESAGEGLFGGMAAGVGLGVEGLAAVGLAALGIAGSTDKGAASETTSSEPVIQVAEATSEGLTVGPGADGSLLLSAGQTEASLLGSESANLTVSRLSVLNPEAEVPSGIPVTVNPDTQTIGIDLGPIAQTEIDITLDTLPDTMLGFATSLTSGNVELEQLIALDLPTSIAGNEVPLTDTLNDGLGQLDSALAPVTEGIQTAVEDSGGLAELSATINDAPVLGDVVGEVNGLLDGGLPTGPLPIPEADALAIPTTGTELDLVSGTVSSAITSVSEGDLPISALPI